MAVYQAGDIVNSSIATGFVEETNEDDDLTIVPLAKDSFG